MIDERVFISSCHFICRMGSNSILSILLTVRFDCEVRKEIKIQVNIINVLHIVSTNKENLKNKQNLYLKRAVY